jgi:murein peptide amidase A
MGAPQAKPRSNPLGVGSAAVLLSLALAAVAAGVVGQKAPADSVSGAATERQLVGRSVEGRAITAAQVGDPAGSRVVLVVGAIHGDERAGLRIARALKRLAAGRPEALAGTQLWVIATVNPDGQRARTRKNARGVDLNRNFPYRWHGDVPHPSGYFPGPRPASEPETRSVMAFVERIQPDLSIWYHQPWGAVLACRGQPQVAAQYAKLVGMRTSCRGTELRGTAISWQTHVSPGSIAFVVELVAGKVRGAAAARHARAALIAAEGG